MPKQKRWGREMILTAVLAFAISLLWIGLAVYKSLKTSKIPEILEAQLKPLNPDFDTQLIDALHLRKEITSSELDRLPSRALILLNNETEKEKVGTAAAKPVSTPESTVSGQISR
ncbi:hypothetical protein A2160_01390 [Candidatus Beckwithbacteria bacterium RBG_13_42_9]|uniref:Uncharacterized protein n=1 Tax=Candidatus Beckwithbacteria bacterium RBG_13_42_9 TaxID=1797457 RepID=A0A1F5E491_9BACT|nr:MAG: hypothetical protein A2160_01390 [Candidatus Beckwithbacteria bacterium RBG_13_42_9]